jgi:hypothetical protein
MSTQKETSVLELIINGKQAETSINGLKNSITKAEREFRKMREADNPKGYQDAAKSIQIQRTALQQMQAQIRSNTLETEKFKSSWKDVAKGVVAGGGILGAVSAIGGVIKEQILDVGRLGMEAESVKTAFARLNSPTLLSDLRKATKGTVSDLELMKQAVSYNNFGLPLSEMGKLLTFAQQRARETGQSVDDMVNSIVTGIARKSPMILDNLGINIIRVNEKFKQTGDFAKAVGAIVEEELQKAGEAVLTTADIWDSLPAKWENIKVKIGTSSNGLVRSVASMVSGVLDNIDFLLERVGDKFEVAGAKWSAEGNAGLEKAFMGDTKEGREKALKGFERQIKKQTELIDNLRKFRESAFSDSRKKELDTQIENESFQLGVLKSDYQKLSELKQSITKKEAEEAQKAAEENEILDKKNEALFIKAAERREKEIADLKKTYQDELLSLDISNMDALDQIIANILKKYDPLITKAKELGQTQLVEDLKQLRDITVDNNTGSFNKKQQADDAAFLLAEEKKQFDASLSINKSFWDQQKLGASEQYANGIISKQQYEDKLREIERLRLEDSLEINKLFGIDNTDVLQQLTDFNISEKERELTRVKEIEEEKNQIIIESARYAADAIFSINADNRRADLDATVSNLERQREQELSKKGKTEAQKKKINDRYDKQIAAEKTKAWQNEKKASLTQAVINGALATTNIWATTPKADFGLSTYLMLGAAGAATLASAATIAAQKPPKYATGGIAEGPSHAQGGIKMIDGRSGKLVGEMEGGEPIISKAAYAANKQTIDEIIFGNARSQTYSMPSGNDIYQSERHYRNGGISPIAQKTQSSGSYTQTTTESNRIDRLESLLENFIVAQQAENAKPVVFSQRIFEDDYARRLQIKNDASS